ncbi:hypothetical protein FCR2A7T_25200 [Flavobacterium cauense R2A-7]|nr:hypothetical protein FCR2A7T_25200 [Flavobacterium cauense R2A-7]
MRIFVTIMSCIHDVLDKMIQCCKNKNNTELKNLQNRLIVPKIN